VGLIGASTSVYANRIGGFAGAVKEYQDALMAFRAAINSNSASKALAKQKVIRAFQNLQIRFRHELNAINSSVKAQKLKGSEPFKWMFVISGLRMLAWRSRGRRKTEQI
jgi:hypothetical protein